MAMQPSGRILAAPLQETPMDHPGHPSQPSWEAVPPESRRISLEPRTKPNGAAS